MEALPSLLGEQGIPAGNRREVFEIAQALSKSLTSMVGLGTMLANILIAAERSGHQPQTTGDVVGYLRMSRALGGD